MKRLILALCGALALAGCGVNSHNVASTGAALADAAGVKPPATTSLTSADEKALSLAAKAVDVAAISSSALVRFGFITSGSPKAQGIARGLDDVRKWVNAAALARQAGNATTFREALAKAEAAMDAVKGVLNSNGG